MSDTRVTPAAGYLVQRFGGSLHPSDDSLQGWINSLAADGWRLITVSEGVGYFERTPATIEASHKTRETKS